MKTIGFWGQVDLEKVDEMERQGVRFVPERRKVINVAMSFLKEQLENFNVTPDWECGYEDGKVEFLVDYEENIDIEPVRKVIENLKGTVTFIRFF